MTIEKIINSVEKNADVLVNFRDKTCHLKIKGKLYPVEVDVIEKENMGEVVNRIEKLYEEYYYSTPTEADKYETYFKAKSYEEMMDDELCNAMCNHKPRKVAKATLELYILCMLLNGSFEWMWGKNWFWQSQNNRELVILKKWFE